MTQEIVDYFRRSQSFIPDTKLTQIQRNTMIELEQQGIVYRSNKSFLGGAPELFWFVDKAKLEAWTKKRSTPKPKPQPKPKKGLRPKPIKKRRTRKRPSNLILQLPIKKWEIVLGIIAFLIILFS